MSDILSFKGFIRGVTYNAHLTAPLENYNFGEFDINESKPSGLIETNGGKIGFSKWVSPKRTRTYPFERIYNTYNSAKIITVIPVIKDEGRDGDLDKIQYSTISWMNLLNVYIVLAYYSSAEKNSRASQRHKQKLTKQRFNNEFVKSQINEIISYKQSALHWNKNLFQDRFVEIFKTALDSYSNISNTTGVEVHSQTNLTSYLNDIVNDYRMFESRSLLSSERASQRELRTIHKFEHLTDGAKGQFFIRNYLGGVYYLTADEIILKNDRIIIQESKNASNGFLPSLCDIRDGLFKLILFSNLDTLMHNDNKIDFSCRLKLTGKKVLRSIRFPCSKEELRLFLEINKGRFGKAESETLINLLAEAEHNRGLEIQIANNAQNVEN